MGHRHFKISKPKSVAQVQHAAAQETHKATIHSAVQATHAAEKHAAAVGHAVGHNVATAAHTLGHNTLTAAHSAGHHTLAAAHRVGQHASSVAHHQGHNALVEAHHIGGAIKSGVHTFAEQVVDAVERLLKLRHLAGDEQVVIDSVFRGTLPLERVLLSPVCGMNGRSFTVPGSFLCTGAGFALVFGVAAAGEVLVSRGGLASFSLYPLLAPIFASALAVGIGAGVLWSEFFGVLYPALSDKYIILFGPGYEHGIAPDEVHNLDQFESHQKYSEPGGGANSAQYPLVPHATLIHESTHVWQGVHEPGWALNWTYVINSCMGQCRNLLGGADPYGDQVVDVDGNVLHHKQFMEYQVEAQANIVEKFYIGSQMKTAPKGWEQYQTYVAGNIQTRNPYAYTSAAAAVDRS